MMRALGLTWNNITCIQRVFVLDEAKSIHELDLCDLSSPMSIEMVLNFLFGGCQTRARSALDPGSELHRRSKEQVHHGQEDIAGPFSITKTRVIRVGDDGRIPFRGKLPR